MALSRHLNTDRNYSAVMCTAITGQFNALAPSDTTQWRGAGWTVSQTGVGTYTLVLAEAIRFLLQASVRVLASDANGLNPYSPQITGPAADGKTFTIISARQNVNGVTYLWNPTNAADFISFSIESDESTGRLR